jgi:hypothetical protein
MLLHLWSLVDARGHATHAPAQAQPAAPPPFHSSILDSFAGVTTELQALVGSLWERLVADTREHGCGWGPAGGPAGRLGLRLWVTSPGSLSVRPWRVAAGRLAARARPRVLVNLGDVHSLVCLWVRARVSARAARRVPSRLVVTWRQGYAAPRSRSEPFPSTAAAVRGRNDGPAGLPIVLPGQARAGADGLQGRSRRLQDLYPNVT